jgi:predicted permease
VPLGFDAAGVVLFDVAAGRNGYDETTGGQLYRDILDRLDRTPGVENASLATERLISGLMSNGSIAVEGGSSNAPARTTFNFVGPNFFDVMRLPIVLGRGIGPAEMAALPRVAVINETTARRYFQGESPLGRRFRWGSKREWDVVVIGVAKDAHYDRLRGDLPATVYVPYTQRPFGWPATVSFAVRTARPTPEVVGDIRKAVAGADGRLPLTNVRTQQEQIDVVLTQERLFASLLAACGTLTLVLACVGLFGFLAHQVVSRTREIGVRMALGASHTAIVRIVLRQVAMTLAVGLIVGLPATWMLARTVESQLYGVTTHDAMSFGVAASVVSGVSLLAALRPLRWAARVNPILALRHE